MSETPKSEVSKILAQIQSGALDHRMAADRLFALTYDELRRLAANLMRREQRDQTIQTTALVNEAYLRLADASKVNWQSRAHFFGIAARVMRQVLVDHARARAAAKRGGGWERVTLDPALKLASGGGEVKLLKLDDILNQIGEMDSRMAQVVELRVFGGLSIAEVAHVLGVSSRTVDNDWSVAKMWVARSLAEGES